MFQKESKMCSWNTDTSNGNKVENTRCETCMPPVATKSKSWSPTFWSRPIPGGHVMSVKHVPIFVDWTKMTHSWGSKFMAIVFSFIIHTENYYLVGTGICGSDPPQKLVHLQNLSHPQYIICIWYIVYVCICMYFSNRLQLHQCENCLQASK